MFDGADSWRGDLASGALAGMPSLPASTDLLLVRTYFGDHEAWRSVRSVATGENADGFRAYVQVIDDKVWDECSAGDLRAAALAGEHAAVLFVVDEIAMEGDFPILVVDLGLSDRRPFRCAARALWGWTTT